MLASAGVINKLPARSTIKNISLFFIFIDIVIYIKSLVFRYCVKRKISKVFFEFSEIFFGTVCLLFSMKWLSNAFKFSQKEANVFVIF